MPEQPVESWDVASFDALTPEDFSRLRERAPELVLLGTGERQRFPRPHLTRPLTDAHIGCEAMDSRAACRTYNILMGEGRKVLAASCSIRERAMTVALDKKVPDFKAASTGGEIRLSELKGSTVVLYFYPKDNTPGCTTEGAGLRSQPREVQESGRRRARRIARQREVARRLQVQDGISVRTDLGSRRVALRSCSTSSR